jgi:hypothetical protein
VAEFNSAPLSNIATCDEYQKISNRRKGQAMPSVTEQMALAKSRTNPELMAARFLLKPGRKYEDAVKAFQPYDKTHEVNDDGRMAAASLISESLHFAAAAEDLHLCQ